MLGVMMKLTQKNFDSFCENQKVFSDALNHRISKIELNVKWIFRIGAYMASLITAIAIKSIFYTIYFSKGLCNGWINLPKI